MRCFIGIPLADGVKEKLVSIQARLRTSGTHMKLVERENLHITMTFLGEIGEERVGKAERMLDGIEEKKFEARLTHIGAFPGQSNARVVWAGFDEGRESIKRIHDRLSDESGYEPHVTLARLKTRPDETVHALFKERLDLPVSIERVQLFESRLGPSGPTYAEVFGVELA